MVNTCKTLERVSPHKLCNVLEMTELFCQNGLALADPHFIIMKTSSHNPGGAPVGESGSDPEVPAFQTSPQVCKPRPFVDMCLRKQCGTPSFRILKALQKWTSAEQRISADLSIVHLSGG